MIETQGNVPNVILAMDAVREVGIKEFIEKRRAQGEGWERLVRIFRYLDRQAGEYMKRDLDAFLNGIEK